MPYKNLLTITVIITLFTFSFASLQYVRSFDKSIQPSSFRSFWVSGEGKVVAAPDVAQFTFSVITEGKADIGKLQKENTEKMNKAIEYVKSKGISPQDIVTQQYSIDPRYQYNSCRADGICPPSEIVGYTVQQSVLVKIRDFAQISDLLTGVVTAGANNVSQLSFTMDDPTQVQDEARKKALQKAKEKAQKLAEDAGFSLGRLLEIDEGYASTPSLSYPMMAYEKGGMGGGGPSIEPGTREVVVNIRLKYEID